jgi:hypothetical protein
MIYDNLTNFNEENSIDGFYLSADSSRLLFEPEWSQELINAIVKAVKDVH